MSKSGYIQFVQSEELNLTRAGMVLSDRLGKQVTIDSFWDFFEKVSEITKDEELIVVLDEYPFQSQLDPSFSSVVQDFIDNRIGRAFLILCGSSVRMMETEISDYSRPLYGRVRKLHIGELPFDESRLFHPDMDAVDSLRLYLSVGGVPYHLSGTPASSYRDYLLKYILEQNAPFRDAGEGMIKMELPDSDSFIRILDAIAAGRRDIKQISDYCRQDRNRCTENLRMLESIGMISRDRPMAGAPEKPSMYHIADRMLAFQYHVVRRMPSIDIDPARALDAHRLEIQTFLGRAFEWFCSDLVASSYPVVRIGKWWGSVPVTEDGTVLRDDSGKVVTEKVDIDIVAEVRIGANTSELFVECKFRNEKCGMNDYYELRDRVSHVHRVTNPRLMLISRSGFTEDLTSYGAEGGVMLVDMDCIIGKREMPRYERPGKMRVTAVSWRSHADRRSRHPREHARGSHGAAPCHL